MLFYYVSTTQNLPRTGSDGTEVDVTGVVRQVLPIIAGITPHIAHDDYKLSVIHCNVVGTVFAMLVQMKPTSPVLNDVSGDLLMHLFDIPGVEAIRTEETVAAIMERRRPENDGTPQNAAISTVSLFAEELLTGLQDVYSGDLLHQLIELPTGRCIYAISYPKAEKIFLAQISDDDHPHYIAIPKKDSLI